MPSILLIEDDRAIVEALGEFLNSEGFEISAADGRTQAESELAKKNFDLVLLDVSLNDGNGFSICSMIKKHFDDTPVIFLTALDDEYSTVTGFDLGADDYINKPFRPRELVSRIKNVLRRRGQGKAYVDIGSVRVDTERGTATKNGRELYLSALEYRLLLVFVNNRGAVLTRSRLLEEIWDVGGDFVNDNTLTVYIKRLRDKIEDNPQAPEIIKTVRGMGYRLD